MTEYKCQNKSGQLCGMLYGAQNRDLFYVILDTTNQQPVLSDFTCLKYKYKYNVFERQWWFGSFGHWGRFVQLHYLRKRQWLGAAIIARGASQPLQSSMYTIADITNHQEERAGWYNLHCFPEDTFLIIFLTARTWIFRDQQCLMITTVDIYFAANLGNGLY